MKKLTYITQLSAVLLLLVQMSSCDKFPSPEPISDKYARPADSISEGMPAPLNGGSIVYMPENKNFRYAAAVIANADGTMSSWFSTPGGSTGSLPTPTDITTMNDGAQAFHGANETRAVRYEFTDDFYGWQFQVATGASTLTAGVHWALYEWFSTYEQTVGKEPVGEIDFPAHGDGAWIEITTDNCGYAIATGRSKFIAGTYLLVATRTDGTPYFWGGTALTPSLMQCYYNGAAVSAGYRSKVQYVSLAESGYSSQIRYFEATTSGPEAVWTADDKAVSSVVPTSKKANQYYAKEPSVVKMGDYYYMTYTGSNTLDEAYDNAVFVARSNSAGAKKWAEWDGSDWTSGSPVAIISGNIPDGMTGKFYGAGASSLVVKDGKIYLYYVVSDSQSGATSNIYLATADANDPNWPSALTQEGMVIDRSKFQSKAMDGASVVYVEERGCFQAICGVDIHSVTSTMNVWESADGVTGWVYKGVLSSNLQVRSKYPRLIRDEQGHVTAKTPKYFFYQHGGEFAKIAWMMRMVPYSFAAK